MITSPLFETVHDASLPLGFLGARLTSDPDRIWTARPDERMEAFRARIARDLGMPEPGRPWAIEIFHHPGSRLS